MRGGRCAVPYHEVNVVVFIPEVLHQLLEALLLHTHLSGHNKHKGVNARHKGAGWGQGSAYYRYTVDMGIEPSNFGLAALLSLCDLPVIH